MIEHRAQSGFLAFEADETDARVRKQLEDGIKHAEAGAEHGHQHDFAAQLGTARGSKRRGNAKPARRRKSAWPRTS